MVVCAIGGRNLDGRFFLSFLTQSAETDTVQTIRAPAKAWAVAKLARQLQVRQRPLQNTPLLCGIAQ